MKSSAAGTCGEPCLGSDNGPRRGGEPSSASHLPMSSRKLSLTSTNQAIWLRREDLEVDFSIYPVLPPARPSAEGEGLGGIAGQWCEADQPTCMATANKCPEKS